MQTIQQTIHLIIIGLPLCGIIIFIVALRKYLQNNRAIMEKMELAGQEADNIDILKEKKQNKVMLRNRIFICHFDCIKFSRKFCCC